MLIILSPAKAIDETKSLVDEHIENKLFFEKDTRELVSIIKQFSVDGLAKLMKISEKLAILNYDRYRNFYMDDVKKYRAILAFKGEAYRGLSAWDFNDNELSYAQETLRILSGLYGVLNPLDIIKEYRLEMGTKLKSNRGNNLYDFWGDSITKRIEEDIEKSPGEKILINLASKEYSSAIKINKLKYEIINIEFVEFREGKYKTVSTYAKKARGMMARFIIKNRISSLDAIKEFDEEGYEFNDYLSNEKNIVFSR